MSKQEADTSKDLVAETEQLMQQFADQLSTNQTNISNLVDEARVSFTKGRFLIPGRPEPVDDFNVVILDAKINRAYFEGAYDANNITPPICHATSNTGEDVRPDADSESPQSEDCASCKWNKFGTAHAGKGKACSEHYELLCASPDDINNTIIYRVPPASIKKFKDLIASTGAAPIQSLVVNISQGDSEYHSPVFTIQGQCSVDFIKQAMNKFSKPDDIPF
jgi:hypothetical protein